MGNSETGVADVLQYNIPYIEEAAGRMTATSEHAGHVRARSEPIGARRLLPVFVGLSAAVHALAILALTGWDEPAAVGQSGNMEAMSIQVSIATSIGIPEVTAVEEAQEASKTEKATVQENQRPPVSEEAAPVPPQEAPPEEKPKEVKTASAGPAMAQMEAQPVASGASSGEIEKFGREVSMALSKSVPKGKGQKGQVTLAFVLGIDGKIARLDIVSPSGSAGLDEAAQDAVRKAVFPPPPQSMSEKLRTYVIPFRFR